MSLKYTCPGCGTALGYEGLCWKCKCKSRPGISCAIGWLKHGEQPGRIRLVHSAFQTYDRAEQEYPCAWDIFCGSIIDIKILKFA